MTPPTRDLSRNNPQTVSLGDPGLGGEDNSGGEAKVKKHFIGILAITLGVLSLCLSVYLYDAKEDLQTLRNQNIEGTSKITFKFGEHEVAFRSKSEAEKQSDYQEKLESKEKEVSLVRYGMISLAGFSLLLVPLSWVREGNRIIATFACALPLAAISWHFIAVGITIGVAIVIIIVLLSMIGGSI